MKIKLHENLPLRLCLELHNLVHDVHSVLDESLGGASDAVVWSACCSEGRFLITQDLDFADTRKYPPGSHSGIRILRLSDDSREGLIRSTLRAFSGNDPRAWSGALVVVTETKMRIRSAFD